MPSVGAVEDGYEFLGGNPGDPNNWRRLPPKAGHVEDGYRFLGGNPADPASWRNLDEEPSTLGEIGRGLVRSAGRVVEGIGTAVERAPKIIRGLDPVLPIMEQFGYKESPEARKEDAETDAWWKEQAGGTADWIREAGQDITSSVAPRFRPDMATSYEQEGITGALKSLAITTAEGSAPTLAGLLTGVLTKNPTAAMSVMGITGAPQTYAGIVEEQKRKGIEDERAAVYGTAASTALDILTGGGRAVSGIGKEAILNAFENGMRSAAKETLKTGGEEAVTEMLQNVIEQVAGYADPTTKQSILQTLEAGAAGGLGGTFFGGTSEGINSFIASRYQRAAASVPSVHTINITLPEEQGGGQEAIDIISAPTEDGTVVARTKDGKVFNTTLDDLESMRTSTGEEERPLRDILKDKIATAEDEDELHAAVMRTLENPEDQEAFNTIVDRYEKFYGLPREQAVAYARESLASLRPKTEEVAVPSEAEAVPEPTLAGTRAASAAAPTTTPEPYTVQSAVDEYIRRITEQDTSPNPELEQFFVNNGPAISAEFIRRQSAASPEVVPEVVPETTAPLVQALSADEQAAQAEKSRQYNKRQREQAAVEPEQVLGTAPEEETVVETAPAPAPTVDRMAAFTAANTRYPGNDLVATAFYNGALGTPQDVYFQNNATEEERAAYQEGQQFAGQTVDQTLTAEALGVPQVAPEELVTEPVAEVEEAPEEAMVPAQAKSRTAEVPVTKVAPGEARGARPIQRGMQGVAIGRPVEGAAELTPAMQDEQALTERLRKMRTSNLISDQDIAELLNLVRVPTSKKALDAMPPSQRERWQQVINLHKDMEAKAEQRDQTSNKREKAQLNAAVKAIETQLDNLRSKIAKYATNEASMRVWKRKQKRAEIETAYKAKKITKKERDTQLRELRVESHLAEFMQESDITRQPTDDEARFVQSGLEGKSFEDGLQWAIDNAPNEAYRAIAEAVQRGVNRLAGLGWTFNLEIAHEGDPIPRSMFNSLGITRTLFDTRKTYIILHGADVTGKVGTSFETFLHEAVHAAAVGLVTVGNYKSMAGTQVGDAVADLYDVFNHVVREFNAKTRSGQKLNAVEQAIYDRSINFLANPHELLAWTMSNPEAMRYLDTVDYTPKQTVFGRIVEIVRKVLGLSPRYNSALAEVLRTGEQLFDFRTEEARTAFDNYSAKLAPKQNAQQAAAEKKVSKGVLKAQRANDAAGFLSGIDEATDGLQLSLDERLKATRQGFLSTVRPATLTIQPSSWIRDNIAKIRPGLGSIIEAIDKLEQQMRGMRSSLQNALRRRTKEFERFVGKYGQEAISAMMTIARVNRVDVVTPKNRAEAFSTDKLLNYYKKQKNARGINTRTRELNDAWDAWETLGEQEGGHAMYKQVRQFYKDMYVALRAAQDNDIRALGLDKQSTDNLIKAAHGEDDIDPDDMLTDEDDHAHPGVPQGLLSQEYFPFRRFGDYALLVQTGKRRTRERYHFDTATERNLFMARRAKQLGLKPGTEEYETTFRKLDGLEELRDDFRQDSLMLNKMFSIIDKADMLKGGTTQEVANAKQSLKDKLYQTYLMTLPERSLRKQFLHAELVTGQSADALRVFKVAVSQYAAQLPKVVYGGQIQRQIEAAYDTAKEGDPDEVAKLRSMVTTYVGRVRDTMDPQMQGNIERQINNFTFLQLMTSMASAIVQPLVLPFQVMPRFISHYGFDGELKTLSMYTPLLNGVKLVREQDPSTGESWLVTPSIGNSSFIKNSPLRAALWKQLNDRRDLFSQKHADMLLRNRPSRFSAEDTLRKRIGAGYEGFVNASGAVFSSFDQLAREMAGMSYAELEYTKLKREGKTHEQAMEGAVETAIRNTNETIGNYTELEKPNIFRGNALKRMIGFLRTYAVQRIAYYFRTMGALVKGSPTQTRMQAFNELSMVLAFTAMGAGVSANFGYSFICTVIDLIMSAMLSDEEKDEWRRKSPLGADDADYRFRYEWIPSNFGPDSTVTRIMQRGALAELTGWDFSTRLSQNEMLFRDYRKGDNTKEDVLNFLEANLAPQVSLSAGMLDGVDQFAQGNWSKGFSKLMPASVRGLFTAERLGTEGETTSSGRKVMGAKEFSTTDLVGQAIGFTPTELSAQREINRGVRGWQSAIGKERGRLFKEFRDVFIDPSHPPEELQGVFAEMRAFNNKLPIGPDGLPLKTYRIEPEDLESSLRSAAGRDAKSYRGVQFAPGEAGYFYPYEERTPVQ